MSMTDLERVTNQRDYNRRLADHQQTVIDRLNAQITAMQEAAREKDAALLAAEELVRLAGELAFIALTSGHDNPAAKEVAPALAAYRAATGGAA